MIYFLRNEVPIDSARRYFHQQRELCDAVSAEIKAAFAKLRDEMMVEQELQSNRHYLGANVIVDVAVDTIPYPWDSFESFRSFHLKSTPTKAKQKYLAIVAHLTHHQTLAEFGFNIPVIINEVLAKVMACTGLSPALSSVVPRSSEQCSSDTQFNDEAHFRTIKEEKSDSSVFASSMNSSTASSTGPTVEAQVSVPSTDPPSEIPMNGGYRSENRGYSVHPKVPQGRRSDARKSRAAVPLISAFKPRRETHPLSFPAQCVSFRPSRHLGPHTAGAIQSVCRTESDNRIEEVSNFSTLSTAAKTCDSDSEDSFVEVCVWSVLPHEPLYVDEQQRWESSMSSAIDDSVTCPSRFEESDYPIRPTPNGINDNRHKTMMVLDDSDFQHTFKWDVEAEDVGEWAADAGDDISEIAMSAVSSMAAPAPRGDGQHAVSVHHKVAVSYSSMATTGSTDAMRVMYASSKRPTRSPYSVESDSNDADVPSIDHARAEREQYYRSMMVMPSKAKATRATFCAPRRSGPKYFEALHCHAPHGSST